MKDLWSLPGSITVAGTEYSVNTDYRDILQIIQELQDPDEDPAVKGIVGMSLFFDSFESIPAEAYDEAMTKMLDFIALGEQDSGQHRPKLIDWDHDAGLIVSEVNKVIGTEVRALDYLHWWTFIGYFQAIGEGQLSYIVGIRSKIQKGQRSKMDAGEREFYRYNRELVDITPELSRQEEDTLDAWLGKK